MDLGLAGRAVLVTGGASGIGAACVAALSREGARVAVLDRNPCGRAAPGAIDEAFQQVDITDEDALRGAIGRAAAALGGGGLHAVVSCAGVSGPVGTPAWDVRADEWDGVMAVNAKGAFLSVKHALSRLDRGGAVVFVASDSAFVAAPGMAPYCASKGAVLMLTRALSVELAAKGIRVNAVCPSIVDTPMSRADLDLPDGFAGVDAPVIDAEEIACHVTYLASPVAASINGAALVVDHGYMARSGFPA